jgi:hypothetical protein
MIVGKDVCHFLYNYFLFHGLPLCQSPHPPLPHLDSLHLAAHVARIALVGPLPSDELEQVPNPLPPPKRGTRFPMLYYRLRLLAILATAQPLVLLYTTCLTPYCVLLPRRYPVVFKLY